MTGAYGKEDLSKAFNDAVYSCCRLEPESYCLNVMSVSGDYEEYSPENDIIEAMQSGTYQEFDGNYAASEPKKKKKKQTEMEIVAADSDAAASKDSWAYKAAQVQKEAKNEA